MSVVRKKLRSWRFLITKFSLSGTLTKNAHLRALVYDFSPCFDAKNSLEICPDISNTSCICQALSLQWCMHISMVSFKLCKCLRLKTVWIPIRGSSSVWTWDLWDVKSCHLVEWCHCHPLVVNTVEWCRYLPVFVNTVEWFRYLPVFVNTVDWYH